MPHQREPASALQVLEALDWTLPSSQGDFSSGVRIGSSPILADPSCLPCIELKSFQRSKEFKREERPLFPVVVDGEEEYEVEAILRHKGKGAQCLYLVMWKGYPITGASWESESHLRNAPLILEDYLHRVRVEDQRQRWNRGNRKKG